MEFGLNNEDLKKMRDIFERFSTIDKVIIFGSRAMGNYKKGSDVDLAICGNFNNSTLSKVKSLLNEEPPLPYFFDVLAYGEIESKDLLDHIEQYGMTIYKKEG